MVNEASKAAEIVALLRRQYSERVASDIAAMAKLVNPPDFGEQNAIELRNHLHKMAGSAGTFGLREMGALARELELQIVDWLADDGRQVAPLLATLVERLNELKKLASHAANVPEAPGEQAATPLGDVTLVGFVSTDASLIEDLRRGLGAFGYRIVNACSVQALECRVEMMLVDADTVPDENPAELGVPFIILSKRSDFDTRFAAARSGAEGFMVKPLDIPRLVDRLDQCRATANQAPYRVLIIDDDTLLARHFQAVLERAGMEACTLSAPSLAMEQVRSFRPDLILLDLYMPECPGPVLARIIRQDEDWLAVPIVYLSAETNMDAQLQAMVQGGDDFLTKPIADPQLVTAVKVRARRARVLSDQMYRDSLTGLLKHARIKDQLAIECERAHRMGESLNVAMVDIDHFKSINDTYGHAMGDRVIKATAQLMKNRVRQTDYVGRYGGEEFAVVLPGCDEHSAWEIIDEIRRAFSEVVFTGSTGSFSATLSAGVARLGHGMHAHEALEAADNALYVSKTSGRNRVTTAKLTPSSTS